MVHWSDTEGDLLESLAMRFANFPVDVRWQKVSQALLELHSVARSPSACRAHWYRTCETISLKKDTSVDLLLWLFWLSDQSAGDELAKSPGSENFSPGQSMHV